MIYNEPCFLSGHIHHVLKPGPVDLPVLHLQFPPAVDQRVELDLRNAREPQIFISCLVQ